MPDLACGEPNLNDPPTPHPMQPYTINGLRARSYPGQGHFFTSDAWNLFVEQAADFFDGHLTPTAD